MMPLIVMLAAIAISAVLILIYVSAYRLWRIRDERRSPLHGKKLPHLPGQQLLDRLAHHEDELLFAISIMYLALPFMLMVWAMAKVPWESARFMSGDIMYVLGGAGMFAYGMLYFRKHFDARAKARDGLTAERMTGQQLNRLAGPDCIVLHDLPGEGFNIDHLVVAPRGVYAVETKSFRKPRGSDDDSHYRVAYDGKTLSFPGWHSADEIKQARRQGEWLARYLREALAQEIPVIPALALPGWWIDPFDGPTPDVKVFTPMGRGAEFMRKPPEVLDASRRALVAQALALRYPDIND